MRTKVLSALAVLGVIGVAAAGSTGISLDVSEVATNGVATLTGLVGDAMPFIVGAIGLGIALRWAKRVFKF